MLTWWDEGRLRQEENIVGFWSVGRQSEDLEFWGRASKGRLNSKMGQSKRKHQRLTTGQVWSPSFILSQSLRE